MTDNQPSFNDNDCFGRKKISEKMIDLLLSNIDVSPMMVDGKWGTGKTIFCKKSMSLLKDKIADNQSKKVKFSYIDAFNSDHADEPLISLVASISGLIDTSTVKRNFIKVAKNVVRFGLKTATKTALLHILKRHSDDIGKELSNTLESSSDEPINSAIDQLIQEHQESENNIIKLKEVLTNIAKNENLIFFVDELDRCRPDFAVDFIECIKHIFDVEGIQFVLLANLEQIEASVKHRYGSDVDAKRYLDKFIKFGFSLPDRVVDANNLSASIVHAKNLIQKSNILKQSSLVIDRSNIFINELILHNSLSLREVETFIRYLEIHAVFSNRQFITQSNNVSFLYIYSVFVFIFKKNKVYKIEKEQVTVDDLCQIIGKNYQYSSDMKQKSPSEILVGLFHISLSETPIPDSERQYWLDNHFAPFFQEPKKDLYVFFIEQFKKLRLQYI